MLGGIYRLQLRSEGSWNGWQTDKQQISPLMQREKGDTQGVVETEGRRGKGNQNHQLTIHGSNTKTQPAHTTGLDRRGPSPPHQ